MGTKVRDSKTFVYDTKKFLGRRHDDEDVAVLNRITPFNVVGSSEKNECMIEVHG